MLGNPLELVRKKASRRYIDIIRDSLSGKNTFPCTISVPAGKAGTPFKERKTQLETLWDASKEKKGKGFLLNLKQVRSRREGTQTILKSITFENIEDYLWFCGKSREYEIISRLNEQTRNISARAGEWFLLHLKNIVNRVEIWPDCLKIIVFFLKGKSVEGLHVRQLPIDISTKFIERNQHFLKSLIDDIFPELLLHPEEQDFFLRYGMVKDTDLFFRVKSADRSIRFLGLQQVAVPSVELHLFKLPDRFTRIVIVENKIAYLFFPEVPETAVIWGSGNAAVLLENMEGLGERNLFYWGDIDPEGFQILCRIRKIYPETRSLMMDKKTFQLFRHLAVPSSLKTIPDLPLLTTEEKDCFQYLQTLDLNRLEQEKIDAEYIYNRALQTVQAVLDADYYTAAPGSSSSPLR